MSNPHSIRHMNTQNLDKISALMDGELDTSEREVAIDILLQEPTAREHWQRHHLISDTLRRHLPRTLDQDLAASVMAAIKDEPTILAPAQGRKRSPLSRRIAGLAVAASVAVFGVLGVQFIYQSDNMLPPQGQVAQLPTVKIPAGQVFQPPGIPGGVQLVDDSRGTPAGNRMPPNLDKYMLNHNQQTARGVQGMIPYARIVTYPNTLDSKQQAQEQR